VKYNISNGGSAPEKVTEAIYARSKVIDRYQILDMPDVDLETLGERNTWENGEVIDPCRIMKS